MSISSRALHSEFQVLHQGRYRTMAHVTNLTGPYRPKRMKLVLHGKKALRSAVRRVDEYCLLKVQALYVADSAQRHLRDVYANTRPSIARFRIRVPDGNGWHVFSFRAEVTKCWLDFNVRSRGPVKMQVDLRVLGLVKYAEMDA